MNQDSKAHQTRQDAVGVQLPPDPLSEWESPPIALVNPPRGHRSASTLSNAPGSFTDRFVAWLRGKVD